MKECSSLTILIKHHLFSLYGKPDMSFQTAVSEAKYSIWNGLLRILSYCRHSVHNHMMAVLHLKYKNLSTGFAFQRTMSL